MVRRFNYWSCPDAPPLHATPIDAKAACECHVQYIDARPARMHEDFRILAAEAMRAAWPCKGHKYRGRPRPKAASDVGVTEHQHLQGEPRRQRQARTGRC